MSKIAAIRELFSIGTHFLPLLFFYSFGVGWIFGVCAPASVPIGESRELNDIIKKVWVNFQLNYVDGSKQR